MPFRDGDPVGEPAVDFRTINERSITVMKKILEIIKSFDLEPTKKDSLSSFLERPPQDELDAGISLKSWRTSFLDNGIEFYISTDFSSQSESGGSFQFAVGKPGRNSDICVYVNFKASNMTWEVRCSTDTPDIETENNQEDFLIQLHGALSPLPEGEIAAGMYKKIFALFPELKQVVVDYNLNLGENQTPVSEDVAKDVIRRVCALFKEKLSKTIPDAN